MHDTVVNEYCAQLTDQDAFLNFDALVKIVAEIQLRIATTSNRIKKYLESQLLKVADHLQQLRTDESWTIAVGYFADRIIVDRHKLRVSYLWFLVDVIGVSNGERKTAVINKLVGQYAGCNPIEFFDGSVYTETIFNLVTSNHLFETYYNVFKPIRFNNDYNSDLIGRLIQLGHLNLAETYCQEQIMYNSREEYNHSYYQFLKEIYSIERDNGKLTEVLKKMSLYTFDFDDYLFVDGQIEDKAERKKWRNKIFAKARPMPRLSEGAALFPFRLMDYEKNYRTMIDYIGSETSYSIIVRYAEKMILADRANFLMALVSKWDNFIDDDYAKTANDVVTLAGILKTNYSESEIRIGLKSAQSGFHGSNMLTRLIKKEKP